MLPDYKKYLKIIGEILGFFILALLILNMAGRFFIEEISQPLFVDISGTQGEMLEPGKNAPYFELHNMDGKLIKFTDIKGVPIVIVFWNTWGLISQEQIRIVDELLKKGDTFYKIITINSQEDRKLVSSFIGSDSNFKPEVLLDFNGSVSDLYEARNLPAIYFISREGVLMDVKLGIMSGQEIVDNISKYSK